MSPIKELMSKGIRYIETPGGPSVTHPESDAADAFPVSTPPALTRSSVPLDVADWSAVYREAGVHPPPHGYGVDRVGEMLETKRFGSLDRDTRRKAILAALDAAGVSIRDVVQDAVGRDHALDAFETFKQREVEEMRVRTEGRIQTVQQELETVLRDSNAELERLKRGAEESVRAFAQFQERKRTEERRLREFLSHFVRDEENPIPA
ncbi:MAG TPA: hypothetical protein VMT87_05760 [Vicinamibacteria bacterium]|nr:hypothetical protein [Vicinamibacteria bacterium]